MSYKFNNYQVSWPPIGLQEQGIIQAIFLTPFPSILAAKASILPFWFFSMPFGKVLQKPFEKNEEIEKMGENARELD